MRRRDGVVDGEVDKLVHFYYGLVDSRAVMMLEDIRVWYRVAFSVADGDGGDDSSSVVCWIVVVIGKLDGHSQGIWLGDVLVAMAV